MGILSSKQINWLLTIAYGYKLRVFVFFLLEILSVLFSLGFVFYSKATIDIALKVIDGNLVYNLIIVVACAFIGVLTRSLSQLVNQKTQISMTLSFQYDVLEKQMISIWTAMKKWQTGDILVRLNSDCTEIVQMISNTWITLLITCFKIIASFIFLYSLDSMLAWIILCITPMFLLAKVYFKRMREINTQAKQSESELGSAMQENLRNRVILRSLGVLMDRLNFYKSKQDKYEKIKFEYINFMVFSQSTMRIALTTGYLIAFAWGVYGLQSLAITFGTMTAFLQLVNQIQSPILSLGAFLPAFVRFRVAVDRVEELNSIEQEPFLKGEKLNVIDRIVLDQVSFKYDEEEIIKNLSVKFKMGEITAIVGASGNGKTTLIRLLLGLVKPNSGSICMYTDNNTYKLSTAHIENFSYVPQGNTLLTGTIRSNITIGIDAVNENKIKEALYLSCADFVDDLPNGIDTKIGESGLGLSEGQAQRIAIARALLRNRNVWLFDEATSALDENTTKLFLNRIKYFIKDKIVIFVTHDPNVSSLCDKQLLMN